MDVAVAFHPGDMVHVDTHGGAAHGRTSGSIAYMVNIRNTSSSGQMPFFASTSFMEFSFGFGTSPAAPFAAAPVCRAYRVAAGAGDRTEAGFTHIVEADVVPFLALDAHRVVGQLRRESHDQRLDHGEKLAAVDRAAGNGRVHLHHLVHRHGRDGVEVRHVPRVAVDLFAHRGEVAQVFQLVHAAEVGAGAELDEQASSGSECPSGALPRRRG